MTINVQKVGDPWSDTATQAAIKAAVKIRTHKRENN